MSYQTSQSQQQPILPVEEVDVGVGVVEVEVGVGVDVREGVDIGGEEG